MSRRCRDEEQTVGIAILDFRESVCCISNRKGLVRAETEALKC